VLWGSAYLSVYRGVIGHTLKINPEYEILKQAVEYEDEIEIARLVAQDPACANATVPGTHVPFPIYAIEKGSIRSLRALLEAGADVNVTDISGDSPMLAAVWYQNTDMITLLLEYGADLSHENREGIFPLYRAIKDHDESLVEFLMDVGADINQASSVKNVTPLLAAILEAEDEIALMIAQRRPLFEVPYLCDKDRLLFGITPLFMTFAMHMVSVAQTLVSLGANINAITPLPEAFTPLAYAVFLRNEEAVHFCLQNGADINHKTGENWASHLHLAVIKDSVSVAKILVDAGHPLDVLDKHKVAPLFYAVSENNYKVAEFLLHSGADVNLRGDLKMTPLFRAVMVNNIPMIKLLLSYNACVNITAEHNTTPLMVAAFYGSNEVVELLLAAGADRSILARDGSDALNAALRAGNTRLAALIEDYSV
jgi:ankyrin repeat protein